MLALKKKISAHGEKNLLMIFIEMDTIDNLKHMKILTR